MARTYTVEPELPITPTTVGREGVIHLDVAVRDHSGKPVMGLTVNDLTLLEDGVPRMIRSFRASSVDNENERLNEVVVVLDEVNSRRCSSIWQSVKRSGFSVRMPAISLYRCLFIGSPRMDSSVRLNPRPTAARWPTVLLTVTLDARFGPFPPCAQASTTM